MRELFRSVIRRWNFSKISIQWIACGAACLYLTACSAPDSSPEEDVNIANNEPVAALDWPLFRRDPEMQGASPERLTPPLSLSWTFEPPVEEGKRLPPIEAGPVIAGGLVYVGSQGGQFYAIKLESGELAWTVKTEGPIIGPAAVHEGIVFVGDTYGFVYAMDAATGAERWRFETDGKIEGGLNLAKGSDGTTSVLFGSHDAYLYSLDVSDGSLQWKHETGNYIVATPSLIESGGEQAVCFGGCDGILHIVPTRQSAQKREIEIGSFIANTSAVRDGICYISHNGGEILAIDVASGETSWKVSTGVEYTASPAVDAKRVYVAGPDKRLAAYDRVTGTELWAFRASRGLDSSPILTGDLIWQGGMDGRLYAIDAATGALSWDFDLGAQIKASLAVSRGVLVVCGEDGLVYGFRK